MNIYKLENFIEHSGEIDNLCKPLYKLGITNFTQLRNYTNGEQIYLSNNSEWIEHYYKFELYKSSLFEGNPSQYHSGIVLWPQTCDLQVFVHAQQYFDSYHGITIIEKNKNYSDFYFLSGPLKNYWLINFYLNNTQLLKNFINFYKKEAAHIIDRSQSRPLQIKDRYDFPRDLSLVQIMPEFLANKITEVQQSFSSYHEQVEQNLFNTLSKKERLCLKYLLQGKTAKETGKIMSISHRTIETHHERIRVKTQCANKFEIISKAQHIHFDSNYFE